MIEKNELEALNARTFLNPETLPALVKGAHATAVEKGWWIQPRRFPETVALIHSEISEAADYLSAGNPPDDKIPTFTGFEAELADVVIRVMDLFGWYEANLSQACQEVALIDHFNRSSSFYSRFENEDLLLECHNRTSRALEFWRKPKGGHPSLPAFNAFQAELAGLVVLIAIFSFLGGYDVTGAIKAKMAFNKTRAYRHGDKRA